MKNEKPTEETSRIIVQNINRKGIKIKVGAIKGSTLISHRLPDDVVDSFMSRELGKSKQKTIRNFDKEYESCFHYTEDGKYGIPAPSFMGAILDAAVACELPKTKIKRALRLIGDMYELGYKKINRRIDHPRRGGMNKTPDTRHRPEFVDWNCDLYFEYDANQITPDQIINLVNQAGFSSGVGDWRPNSPKSCGTHGMFEVKANAAV